MSLVVKAALVVGFGAVFSLIGLVALHMQAASSTPAISSARTAFFPGPREA